MGGVCGGIGDADGGWRLSRPGVSCGRRHLADDDAVADPRHWCCGCGTGGCTPAR